MLLNKDQRDAALSVGRTKAKQRRIKHISNKGRPVKTTGVYYNHQILVSEEVYRYLQSKKMIPKEPLGSVLNRELLRRKKVEGHKDEIDDSEAWVKYGWVPNKLMERRESR